MTTNKRGIELLQDPSLNKSTAFPEAEKQALGIVGLVPDVTEKEDLQLRRVMMQLGHKTTDLDRYIYLVNLLDHNEVLFYRTVMSDPARFCRSSMTRRSGKRALSSVTSTGNRAACACR
jgi:malate dehydrogenase (oxaloacetate-decarboxylating)(NADP+)